MLYLDYSREHGQWSPNIHGGNADLEAISFLKELNTTVHRVHPGVLTIAEEYTAWGGVSPPVYAGGLGFTHKWNMGCRQDTIASWSKEPIWRQTHHRQLNSGPNYTWPGHSDHTLNHPAGLHLDKTQLA